MSPEPTTVAGAPPLSGGGPPVSDGSQATEDGRRRHGGGGGRRRREQAMVPDAEFTSYYGRPVIKAPVWEERDIAGYLFLGGLAGGSAVLAAGADLTGRPGLARAGKLGALGGVGLSVVALVHDLGRPARFVNMLRVAKPSSPMSVGSWLLAAFGPTAGLAALSDVFGRVPKLGRAATMASAAVGPAVASYTAVLLADTAVPSWHEAWRELPLVFVSSGAAAAAGVGLIGAPTSEAGPARRMAVAAVVADQAAMHQVEHADRLSAEPYRRDRAGSLLRAAKVLSIGGAIGALVPGRRSRWASAASGLSLLAGSACTRFGIFAAGVASAEDPRYTVVPQRQRLDARR